MTLTEIVIQLRACGFTCEGGALENNVAFKLLAQAADNETIGKYISLHKNKDGIILCIQQGATITPNCPPNAL